MRLQALLFREPHVNNIKYMNQELLDYIKGQVRKSVDRNEIFATLRANEWQDTDIENAFKYIDMPFDMNKGLAIGMTRNKKGVSKIRNGAYFLTGLVAIIIWFYFRYFHYDPDYWPHILFPLLLLGILYTISGIVFMVRRQGINQAADLPPIASRAVSHPSDNSTLQQKDTTKEKNRQKAGNWILLSNIVVIFILIFVLRDTQDEYDWMFLIYFSWYSMFTVLAYFFLTERNVFLSIFPAIIVLVLMVLVGFFFIPCPDACGLGVLAFGMFTAIGYLVLSLLVFFLEPLFRKITRKTKEGLLSSNNQKNIQDTPTLTSSHKNNLQTFYPIFLGCTILALFFALLSLPESIDSFKRHTEGLKMLAIQKQESTQAQEKYKEAVENFPLGGTKESFNTIISATFGLEKRDPWEDGQRDLQEEPFREFSYALNYLSRFNSYSLNKDAFDRGDSVQVSDAQYVNGWIDKAKTALSRIVGYQAIVRCGGGNHDVDTIMTTLSLSETTKYQWFIFVDEKLIYKDLSVASAQPQFLAEYIQVADDKIIICGQPYSSSRLSGFFDIKSIPGALKIRSYGYTPTAYNLKTTRDIQAESTMWREFTAMCPIEAMNKIGNLEPEHYREMISMCPKFFR